MTLLHQSMMSDIADSFLLVYAALFPIVNPLGTAPVFLSLTRHWPPAVRHGIAWRVALNGFLLLVGSLFVGSHILQIFGITLPVVRIAGGFVVTAMAWQLLRADDEADGDAGVDAAGSAVASDQLAREKAFYPLTLPLTVGPGSIAAAITLGSQRPLVSGSFGHLALIGGAAIVGLMAVAATIYVSYRFAENVERVLGKTGINVLVRLSAFILLCIGVQIMWNGYSGLVSSSGLPRPAVVGSTVLPDTCRHRPLGRSGAALTDYGDRAKVPLWHLISVPSRAT